MREEELEQLTNFLNLSKTGFTAPLYFIQGTVGSGKTHLIERGMVKNFEKLNYLSNKLHYKECMIFECEF